MFVVTLTPEFDVSMVWFTTTLLQTADWSFSLSTASFNDCVDSGEKADEVQADVDAGLEAEVTGTPAFVVEGELHVGFLTVEEFSALLDDAIAAAGG